MWKLLEKILNQIRNGTSRVKVILIFSFKINVHYIYKKCFIIRFSCGKIYKCQTCGIIYSTNQGLIKHLKHKKHAILSIETPTSSKRQQNNIFSQPIDPSNQTKKPLKILSKQQQSNELQPFQLVLINSLNNNITNQPVFLLATPQVTAPIDNLQNDFLHSSLNR